MKSSLYSQLCLKLKNIFTWKKPSTFANLLMEKLGNWFATVKMWKSTWKKKKLRKGSASLLKSSLWDSLQFLLVPINFLVKNINGLHQTTSSTKTWCVVPFKNRKSWTFLTTKMNYFLLLRYVRLHKSRIYLTLTSFSVLHFLSLPVPKSVNVWPQLDNEVYTQFTWLHRIEQAC